jgi:hypothetical protein
MFAPGDCQIVVTYRNSNYLWKDRAVDPTDVTDTTLSPTERAIHCFAPDFWDRFSHPSRIECVMVTLQDRTFRLPWRSEMNPVAPEALSLDIQLHYNGRAIPSSATWQ